MNYIEETITVSFESGQESRHVEMPGVIAEGTGLGYYSEASGGAWMWPVEGGEVAMEPEGSTRYVLTHVASGCGFGVWVYSEAHVRAWLELIAPLTDWTLPLVELVTHPAYPNAQQIRSALHQAVQQQEVQV